MALATTAAVTAGVAATAAYLDAKFHIRKDVEVLVSAKKLEREYIQAVKNNRISPFYFHEEAVNNHPDAQAIWSREGNYTWREVHTRACQYGKYFLELGARPGELVAICLQNSPEMVFAWLGLWAIGCAPALINFNLTGDAMIHCLKVSGAKVLIVDEEEKIRSRVEAVRDRIEQELNMQAIILDQQLKSSIAVRPVERPDDSYRSGVEPDFPAIVIYTSGTTGLPKGATFPTKRMFMIGARRASLMNQRRGPGGDRWYICMPMYHGTGGIHAMTNMMSGTSLAIGKGFSVRNFWRDVHDSESTFIIYVGETARYLLAAPPSPLDKGHKVRCMFGNGLRPDVWKRFQERFGIEEVGEFFNSSEGMLTLFAWDRGPYLAECVGHQGAIQRWLYNDINIPVQINYDTNEIVRDPKTGWAKRNTYKEGGEIIVRVPNEQAFPGYYNNPEATRKKFVRDVFKKGDLFYRTGDALRRSDDGRWFFMDRLGDTYRWKSENVSTAEVADTIGKYPGIHEANVYGVELPGRRHEGRAGCAALTIDDNVRENFDWKAFATFARERLPRYAVPVFIRVLSGEVGSGASHNNKQDKAGLRAEGVAPELRGKKVRGGERDVFFWIKPDGDRYVRFEEEDWKKLSVGGVRL